MSENIFVLALYLNNILDSYNVLGLFFFPLEVYKHWCICYLLGLNIIVSEVNLVFFLVGSFVFVLLHTGHFVSEVWELY